MKKGKNYLAKKEMIEQGKLYDVHEAVALVKKMATASCTSYNLSCKKRND